MLEPAQLKKSLAALLERADEAPIALSAYYAITGRGGAWLQKKRRYHEERWEMERRFLADPSGSLRARSCPACGSSRTRERFTNPVGFSFAICAEDGAVYMDPAPSEDALGALYNDPAESVKYAKEGIRPSNGEDLEAVLRLSGHRSGRLLDIGCSVGGFLLSARSHFEVEGVELNDHTATVARGLGLSVTTGRVADLAEDRRFDVITMLQLVEHIVEPEPFLREVAQHLAPGGRIYLNTPAVDSASFEHLKRDHVHVASFGHVSLLTKIAIERLAARAGLRLVAHEHCGGLDLSFADLATHALAGERFRHRFAMYSPRLYYASDILDRLPLEWLKRLAVPAGGQSYQRAVLALAT